MQIILKEDIKNLGQMGNVVNVKDGYARNFLIPKGLAVYANLRNIKALEHEKRRIQKLSKKVKTDVENLASRLSTITITIQANVGKEGKFFGSVTTMNIADALKKEGIDIDRKKIILEEPIKTLGSHVVNIKLHPEVSSQISVLVVAE